jgi:putative peptidoglycan lipid II flippase
MSQMLKSSGAMGLATLISRMLGLVREQVYAAFMGTSAVAGAFQMAFTVPNLFRRLLGEGALTAAFIPIFKAKEKTEGEQEMWRSANVVISGLVVSAAAVVGLVLLGITLVLSWSTLPESTQLMLRLLQVMFP